MLMVSACADGMRMDLQKSRYHSFDELYEYCYKVAGTVGEHSLVCALSLTSWQSSNNTLLWDLLRLSAGCE